MQCCSLSHTYVCVTLTALYFRYFIHLRQTQLDQHYMQEFINIHQEKEEFGNKTSGRQTF